MAAVDDATVLLRGYAYTGSGNWIDESGNGHHGTFNGGVESTFDGSRFFMDGVSGGGDFITIGGTALDYSSNFTVAVAVLIPTGEPSGNTVLSAKKASLGGSQGWAIWGSSLANINGRVHDGTTGFDVAFPTGNNDAVEVYVLRRDATGLGEWTGWVDSTRDAGTPDSLGDCTSASAERIGAEGGGFNNFGGYVYAYAVWERSLSDAEVGSLLTELTVPPSAPSNRMGGTGAIRKPPRR